MGHNWKKRSRIQIWIRLRLSFKQFLQSAHSVGDLIHGNLGLHALDQLFHHIIRNIHSQQLLQRLDRFLFKLRLEGIVLHDLFRQLFNGLFDIHPGSPHTSSTGASGAFFLTDSMPFRQLALAL